MVVLYPIAMVSSPPILSAPPWIARRGHRFRLMVSIASFVMVERDVNVNAGECAAAMRVGGWLLIRSNQLLASLRRRVVFESVITSEMHGANHGRGGESGTEIATWKKYKHLWINHVKISTDCHVSYCCDRFGHLGVLLTQTGLLQMIDLHHSCSTCILLKCVSHEDLYCNHFHTSTVLAW